MKDEMNGLGFNPYRLQTLATYLENKYAVTAKEVVAEKV